MRAVSMLFSRRENAAKGFGSRLRCLRTFGATDEVFARGLGLALVLAVPFGCTSHNALEVPEVPEPRSTIDDGPVITDGPKLRVIVGVEGGAVGTGSIDGPPGVADFSHIVYAARGPYSGPGAYDGLSEIESLLVVDRSSDGLALRYVDPVGNVTTLERHMPEGGRTNGFPTTDIIVPIDHAVLVGRVGANQELDFQRYGLDGSTPTRLPGFSLNLTGPVGAAAYAPTGGQESLVLEANNRLFRWTPGTPPAEIPTVIPRDNRLLSVLVDRTDGAFYLWLVPPGGRCEDGIPYLVRRRESGAVDEWPYPVAFDDTRVVRGEVRSVSQSWEETWGLAKETHVYPSGYTWPFRIAREHDFVDVRDEQLIRSTKMDRSDAVLFAGREFARSQAPLTNCQLSQSPRRTPWLACDEGLAAVDLFGGQLVPQSAEAGSSPLVWIDVNEFGTVESLDIDGVFREGGVARTHPLARTARPAVAAARDSAGVLWAVAGAATSNGDGQGGLFRLTRGDSGFSRVWREPYGKESLQSLVAIRSGVQRSLPLTSVYAAGWGASSISRLDANGGGFGLRSVAPKYRKVRRFGEVLYGATASTIDRIDLEKDTVTTVLGTPGRYGFSSDGSAVPFIDDFTFDAQGGIVIYSNATRSVYYARP